MKRDYSSLLIAAGAIIFTNVFMPFIESFANKTINKWQIDMQLDQAEAQAASEVIAPSPCHTNAIGFQISSNEGDNNEEDY